MVKIPVWLDCDTGTDDSIAILALNALEEIDLLGISAVCGNTYQKTAFYNTHRVCGLAGAKYPVYPGAEKPLHCELKVATAFHGSNGLGDVELPVPEDAQINEEAAWDALYECALENRGSLRLVATGPLTNIATAFLKYPDLPSLLHSLYIMGGSADFGNVTPAAEFNVHADPHAAEIVFSAGIKVHMFGLNATLQEWLDNDDLNELLASGTKCGRFAHDCLQRAMISLRGIGLPGVSMHDSCPVLYLTNPEMFTMEDAGVHVETKGKVTFGKTVTDLYSDKQFDRKNASVCTYIDREAFISKLKSLIIANG